MYRDGSIGDPTIPRGIRMDESGRLIDEKGNVLKLNENKSLKINKKNERKRNARPLRQIHRKAQIEKVKFKQSEYFDPELEIDKGDRRKRRKIEGLNFKEQGSYIEKADAIRKKEVSKQLEANEEPEEIQHIKPSIDDDPKAKIMRKINQMKPLEPIPEVEWWDSYLLPEGQKTFNKAKLNSDNTHSLTTSLDKPLDIEDFKVTDDTFNSRKVTHFVQHPVPLKNPQIEKIKSMSVPIHLTEKERKRLKKLKKAEKVKDRHEKISLGLMPAPESRLKMSSFMRAVTAQAVADPSAVEKEVRRQEAERQRAHKEHNESRKLTKQQRAEK